MGGRIRPGTAAVERGRPALLRAHRVDARLHRRPADLRQPGRRHGRCALQLHERLQPLAGTDLLGILAEGEPYCPQEWTPSRIEQDVLDMLGSWYWGPVPFTLRLTGDVLELGNPGGDGQAMRFRPDGEGGWTGVDGYQAGEPLAVVTGPDGPVTALNIGSFIYTRTPHDPAAPVPRGIAPRRRQAAPAQ